MIAVSMSAGQAAAGIGFNPIGKELKTVGAPYELLVRDFDGDGHQDIVVFTSEPIFFVQLNGSEPVALKTKKEVGEFLEKFATGQISEADVVVTERAQGRIHYFRGAGNGTFAEFKETLLHEPKFSSRMDSRPMYAAASDFNNDQLLDLVIVYFSGRVDHYLGQRDGTFMFSQILAFTDSASNPVVADFDKDGVDDVIVIENREDRPSQLLFFKGDLGGLMGKRPMPLEEAIDELGESLNKELDTLLPADVDGDGRQDLIVMGITSIVVLRNTANGFVLYQSLPTYRAGLAMALSSPIGDGQGIHLVSSYGFRNRLQIHDYDPVEKRFVDNDGSFEFPKNGSAIQIDDVDRDGHLDIVVGEFRPGRINYVRGLGEGRFDQDITQRFPGAESISAMALQDMNHDKKPDLVVLDVQNAVVFIYENAE